MPIPDVAAFLRIGGAPSGKWGSNYSTICKLLNELDAARDPNIAYNNKAYQDKFETFYAAVQRFHPNDSGGTNAKKTSEIAAVRTLKDSAPLRQELDLVRISRLLDKMTTHALLLVSNTGREIIRKVKDRSFKIGIIDIPNVNAQCNISSNTMLINVASAATSEKLAMGVVVHEYHHYLTQSDDKYADEFVAHWKQYLAMGLTADKFAKINPFLLDEEGGYKMRHTFLKGRTPFTRPEEAGTLWSGFIDNRKTG